jgi:hypothetical protein
VKPEVDTLPTVPDDPPAAGPDRALEPPPADPGPPAAVPPAGAVEVLLAAVVDGEVALGEDEPQPASPIAAHVNAAAMIRRLLLCERKLAVSEAFMVFLNLAVASR